MTEHGPERHARSERLAEQARRERAALIDLDRATARLAAAQHRHAEAVADADAVVAAAIEAHQQALAHFARHAGAERAAYLLGLDARELARISKRAGP
jgi:hypothetical protein